MPGTKTSMYHTCSKEAKIKYNKRKTKLQKNKNKEKTIVKLMVRVWARKK